MQSTLYLDGFRTSEVFMPPGARFIGLTAGESFDLFSKLAMYGTGFGTLLTVAVDGLDHESVKERVHMDPAGAFEALLAIRTS